MWEDFVRRRPTKVDYLQGAIVRLAERHGVEVPLSRRVIALVKQAETEGRRAAEADTGTGPPRLICRRPFFACAGDTSQEDCPFRRAVRSALMTSTATFPARSNAPATNRIRPRRSEHQKRH